MEVVLYLVLSCDFLVLTRSRIDDSSATFALIGQVRDTASPYPTWHYLFTIAPIVNPTINCSEMFKTFQTPPQYGAVGRRGKALQLEGVNSII